MHEPQRLIGNTWAPGGSGRRPTVLDPADGGPVTVLTAASADGVTVMTAVRLEAPPTGW